MWNVWRFDVFSVIVNFVVLMVFQLIFSATGRRTPLNEFNWWLISTPMFFGKHSLEKTSALIWGKNDPVWNVKTWKYIFDFGNVFCESTKRENAHLAVETSAVKRENVKMHIWPWKRGRENVKTHIWPWKNHMAVRNCFRGREGFGPGLRVQRVL